MNGQSDHLCFHAVSLTALSALSGVASMTWEEIPV
jgi:hypothetical protein